MLSAAIDELVERLREHWEAPGVSVAVLQGGVPIHVRGYGVSCLDTGRRLTEATALAIGSCSKPFTAAAAAILIDDGRLKWDSRVRDHLADFRLCDDWISDHLTVRDCLANRIGLSRASLSEYGSDLSRSEVLRRAAHIALAAEFRDRYAYSNIGFIVVAEVIASVSGQPFEQFVEDRIFAPLELKHTTIRNRQWQTMPDAAMPHRRIDGKLRRVSPMDLDNSTGAGSIWTSAEDAVHWLSMLDAKGVWQGRQIISEARVAEVLSLQVAARDDDTLDGYGLGWCLKRLASGRVAFHDGGIRGFQAYVMLGLDRNYACFVAVNQNVAAHAIASNIQSLLVGEKPQDWIAYYKENSTKLAAQGENAAEANQGHGEGLAPRPIEAFIGVYRHPGLGTLHLSLDRDCLRLKIENACCYDAPVVRHGALRFEYQGDVLSPPRIIAPSVPNGSRPWLEFFIDDGRIAGFDWHEMWFGDARFTLDPVSLAARS